VQYETHFLSSADPGRPIDWQIESRPQAWRTRPAVYSLPLSVGMMTPATWPPRTATAMTRALWASWASWCSPSANPSTLREAMSITEAR